MSPKESDLMCKHNSVKGIRSISGTFIYKEIQDQE